MGLQHDWCTATVCLAFMLKPMILHVAEQCWLADVMLLHPAPCYRADPVHQAPQRYWQRFSIVHLPKIGMNMFLAAQNKCMLFRLKLCYQIQELL